MDSREPQQYRLKPGIDLRITDLKDGLSFVHYQDDYVQWETEHVNALFETVDIDATLKQLTGLVTDLIQMPRGKTINPTAYVDRILDVTLGRKQ